MKNILFIVLLLLFFVQVNAQKNNLDIKNNKTDAVAAADSPKQIMQRPTKEELAKIKAANIETVVKTQFQYFIIRADSASFGYSIYADGNLYIHQTTIPAKGGKSGFANVSSATKTAQLVIQKIKQGELPPTLSVKDLKKNNLIN